MSNGAFAALVVVVNLIITQVICNVAAPKIIGDAVHLPISVIIAYLLKKIGRQDPFPGQQLTTEIHKISKSIT